MSSIHSRIKDKRLALGLSMEDLAKKVDVKSWQTVQQWENGTTGPSRKRVALVADALMVSQAWLLTGEVQGAGANTTSMQSAGAGSVVGTIPRAIDPAIAEVIRLMEATDDIGRQLALGGVRAALAAHKPAKKQGLAG